MTELLNKIRCKDIMFRTKDLRDYRMETLILPIAVISMSACSAVRTYAFWIILGAHFERDCMV